MIHCLKVLAGEPVGGHESARGQLARRHVAARGSLGDSYGQMGVARGRAHVGAAAGGARACQRPVACQARGGPLIVVVGPPKRRPKLLAPRAFNLLDFRRQCATCPM